MTTTYPSTYDSFSTKEDNVSDVRASDINNVQDSVVAIQTSLGLNVAGRNQPSGWTLADRLAVFINDNGTLKSTVLTSSDIPSGSISNTKIFHNDVFEFKSIKVGQHSGTYGYTGSGPGTNAGITIDENGNILCDGNFSILGTQTFGNIVTMNNSLIVNSNCYLGSADSHITQVTGTFLPSITSKYNIGSSTLRWKTAYIDVILGQSTGGDTLTVATSGIFNQTLIIKAASDSSSGDSIGFIGTQNGSTVIQAASGANLLLNPYEGTVVVGGNMNVIGVLTAPNTYDFDIYPYFIKYPYVGDDLQEHLIAFSGTITEIKGQLGTACAGTDFTLDIERNGNIVKNNAATRTLTITNGSSGLFINTTMDENIVVTKNDVLGLSVKQVGSTTTGGNLRVQVKVKRLVQWE